MPRFLAILLIATTATANETSYRTLQSGGTGTPLHDRGLHGENQIVAVLDTGVDYRSCFFAEPDGSRPPVNTRPAETNVDYTRRKIIAYDFLYSCNEYPGAPGCDDPANENAYDNQGHGTHAASAAVADRATPLAHDYADAIAPGAKLVVQDAGFIGGDDCSHRPGIGCPVRLTPILEQAYRQGARIHSNSWGDRQGTPPGLNPPTANYPQSAHDVDAFVWSHPEMLVVFNTGNFGGGGNQAPAGSLSAPGSAKNTLQTGGTRTQNSGDDVLANITLVGPTRDGRIKPDVVGPALVLGGDARVLTGSDCGVTFQGGTSWAAPTVAGAAALVRQYYTEGFHPTGAATASNRFVPSAALIKATIIASARRVPFRALMDGSFVETLPVPSYEQGFGFPVLDDALYFAGDRAKLRVFDVPADRGLAEGESFTYRVGARAGTPLKAVLVWTDPPGVVASDGRAQLVNDLDLRITAPNGIVSHGNEPLHPGQPDRLNNVEGIAIQPQAGIYTITVAANRIAFGPKQSFALVVTGDFIEPPRHRATRS